MHTLVELYLTTIICGALGAAALAILGCHLATRDKSMQTLCITQGAMLGVLAGMGFFGAAETHTAIHVGPNVLGVAVSTAVFMITEILMLRNPAAPNTLFISIFGILLATSYTVSALFPSLESHLAQVYFGDLATLCAVDAFTTATYALVCLALLLIFYRPFTKQSFHSALFGQKLAVAFEPKWFVFFTVIVITMLSMSIQFLGFLFTISCLFLPTMIMSRMPVRGLYWHYALSAGLAAGGSVVGFMLSLHMKNFPTVPAIVLTMTVIGLVLVVVTGLVLTKWRRVETGRS